MNVVNVDLQIMPDLFLKTGLHTPLVGGPCILQNEWHFYVEKHLNGVMNGVAGWSALVRGI
jgi:hypothetical protein